MTEQEHIDLEKLKADQAKERESAFWLCCEILRADESYLRTMGYKSIEQGLRNTIERSLKKLEQLAQAFIRKYPDQGV